MRIAEVREDARRQQGPQTTITVQVQSGESDVLLRPGFDADAHREYLATLARAGVDQFVIQLPCAGVSAAVEGLHAYAALFSAAP